MAKIDIRACTEDDLPAVADLLLANTKAAAGARERVVEHAREVYFRNPWHDPEMPSLVCHDAAGRLQGFIGVTARRMRLAGETVDVAVPGNYVVRPGEGGRGSGFAAVGLMRRFLSGKQAASITDTANDNSRRLWEAAGGFLATGYSIDWFRPIRPAAALLQIVEAERGAALPLSRTLRLAGRMADAVGGPLLRRMAAGKQADATLSAFDPDYALALLAGARADLVGAYDRAGFDWLLAQVETKAGGRTLVGRTVAQGDQPCGAFLYLLRANGYAEVLLSLAREGAFETLLSAMIADAAERGAAVLTGPIDPRRLPAYKSQHCFMFGNQWCLVHTRRGDIADAFHRGRALLTGLDGEKWTQFGDLFAL